MGLWPTFEACFPAKAFPELGSIWEARPAPELAGIVRGCSLLNISREPNLSLPDTPSYVASAEVVVVSESPLILVVEDEYPLQGIVEDALAEAGFETDILSSAEEALTLFKGGSKNYKALVTDVSLKGRLSGWDVARQVRVADPAFPVVYMTGAAADQWASQGVPNSILLEKPFAPAQLVTAIPQLLNIGSAPRAPV